MADELNGTEDAPTQDAAPLFAAVPVADLPANTPKGASPETIALGSALLAIVTPDTAARDSVAYADRKDAIARRAAIKRAVTAAGGAPKGKRIALSILAGADGYAVVARLADAFAPKTPAKAK